uniref:Uncharacterized protein n=1 Tax=Soybean thrips tombus-like virus 2 TaxID=2802944 RepID=A0A7T8G256_9TOMB|nr:hypothetical protein 2 [Soybean thrips tombus-like virus 2]
MQVARPSSTRAVRNQLVNAFLPYLPAIMNSGSNLVRGIAQQYRQPPPVVQVQPAQPRRRRGRRGGRRRARGMGAPARNLAPQGSGVLTLTDTEFLTSGGNKGALVTFTVPQAGLKRLKAITALYEHYKILRMSIIVSPLSGSASDNTYSIAVVAGGVRSEINSHDIIRNIANSRSAHSSVRSTLVVNSTVLDNSHWQDGTVCSIYMMGSGVSVSVSYSVQFSSPLGF